MKYPHKDELAFPEFEDVPNSQVILYSFSPSFLDTPTTTTKKKKKKKGKNNRRKNTHLRELTFKIQFSLNTI